MGRRKAAPIKSMAAGAQKSESSVLRLLSWNIDGLDEKNRRERTEEVCRIILLKQPHVVFLQEIVLDTIAILIQKLGHVYSPFAHGNPPAHYYPAILVNKKCDEISLSGMLNAIEFPRSTMGRHLLQMNIIFHGVSFQLITTHLESTADCAPERVQQLRACFGEVAENTRQGKICIFGGDLNLRDKELKGIPMPERTVDVWEACGSVAEEKYTWDMSVNNNLNFTRFKPKLRFDRLYLTQAHGVDTARPVKFELIGKDPLASCGRYPSDHWGLWTEFSVCHSKDTTSSQ